MALTRFRSRFTYLEPLLAIVLIVALLYFAKTVIVPLALAILLTFVLTPVVAAIQRNGLTRIPAVFVTVLLTFLLFGLVGWIVVEQIHHLASELPTHRKEIDVKIAGLRGAGAGPFSDFLKMVREIFKGETKEEAADVGPAPKEKVVVIQAQEPSGFEQVANAGGFVLEPLAQSGLVTILVIFMLIKREDLRNRVIALLGHGHLTGTTRVLVDAAQRVSRFLLTQMLINVSFGVLFAVGLFIIGVPYAFLWGFLAMLLRFVPYIGSLVALTLPLTLAFAVAPGWTQPILVLAFFGVLELVTANVVEPLLFGHGTGVSPIALLVAAAFWTWIWGPIGLVLATPMTVCLVTLGQHMPRLRFFAMLLGDKPALEPHVAYYQRLLARDQAEAQQVAVEYAKTHGKEAAYDEVLLPALALARRDRKDAGLSAEDEGFILQGTRDITQHLDTCISEAAELGTVLTVGSDGRPTVLPESPTAPVPEPFLILACPAHHEAEELSLTMLAQLLRSNGCKVEAVSTKSLPGEIETRIKEENPALVFVAVLPGGFVQARYLCKRLRKRFAELPIVVGYWGDQRHYDKVLVRMRAAGANYLTTSLGQTRSQIRALLNLSPRTAPQLADPKSLVTSGDVPVKTTATEGIGRT